MIRIKRGNIARKRRNLIFEFTSSYYGKGSKLFKIAVQKFMKAMSASSQDSKKKKICFRQMWIVRINAACRITGICYNQFMNKLKIASILINRKMLSQIAIFDFWTFSSLAKFRQGGIE